MIPLSYGNSAFLRHLRLNHQSICLSVPDNGMLNDQCFGKFQRKTREFRLLITALDHLSQYARYKVWIKPKAEMSFVYGNHVLKAQVSRCTENAPQSHGVIVYNQSDVPLGFGSMARSTSDSRKLDPTAIMVFNQADIGEYLRHEETMFAK